tara:strand:- start:35 stop:439 length:405 start_codon:yes stop_codon:yes gene_type:complete
MSETNKKTEDLVGGFDLSDSSLVSAIQNVIQGTASEEEMEKVKSNLGDTPVQTENKDSAYQKFFKKALKKFGVKEPDELSGEKKKEFFNYVDKNWKAKDENKSNAKLTKSGRVDGRTKQYRETVRKILNKKKTK